uniref:Uncharacterized protein n=1 Tax=Arundo donax TaxID=35708 RepID=A0A0A8ZJ33_ARUDO
MCHLLRWPKVSTRKLQHTNATIINGPVKWAICIHTIISDALFIYTISYANDM